MTYFINNSYHVTFLNYCLWMVEHANRLRNFVHSWQRDLVLSSVQENGADTIFTAMTSCRIYMLSDTYRPTNSNDCTVNVEEWISKHVLSHIIAYSHWYKSLARRLMWRTEHVTGRTYYIPCYDLQYIPRNMHTVFALLCVVVVIHWLIFPYPSGLLHWHCGNLTIAPVPAKQPWWIWWILRVNSLWTIA